MRQGEDEECEVGGPTECQGLVVQSVEMGGLVDHQLSPGHLVLRQVILAHQLEPLTQVVHSDHGGELSPVLDVARLRHQDQEILPEEKRGREEAGGVERQEVVAVEEGGVLALLPAPDEDVVEGVVDVVLDDDEEVLVPVPVHPHSPPLLSEGAVTVSGPEFLLTGVRHHPRHRQTLLVRHEQPPQLVTSSHNVPSHPHPSLEDFLPDCGLLRQADLVELLA